jgi:hypothetical protein
MIRSRSSTTCSSADLRRRALALAVAALTAASPAAAAATRRDRLLLAVPYPIEAAPSFPAGLFHWIDSLAGTTQGKTVPAHRAEYLRLFGPLTEDDRTQLEPSSRPARSTRSEAENAMRRAFRRASAMLGVFCGSATVDAALARSSPS